MVTRPFRRKWKKVFSSSDTSKKGHFVKGNPAVSPVASKLFRSRKVRKNGHFVNSKPAVTPEAWNRFLKVRNVQKLSLREREPDRIPGGEETFLGPETSEKMVIFGNSKRPFRRKRENVFSRSETSKNGHFANGKLAVSPVARKCFSGPETSKKMVISGTVNRPYRRKRKNAFSSSETSKNGHFAIGIPTVLPVAV